jgi:GNAT superfamily N-acetyltransferase
MREPMVRVRKAREEDFEGLFVLLNAYLMEIGEEGLSGDDERRLRTAVEEGRITFFVAEEGELLGTCSLTTAFSTFGGGREYAILEDFYVVPDRRGSGIAAKLTRHVFDEATARGMSSVVVGCAECDVAMYRHLGFSLEIGRMLSRVLD